MRAFIFDTETSGLIDNHTLPLDKQPEIIEFYGADVDLKTGEILSEIEILIKPHKPISEEITNITGLENSDFEKCLPFSAHAPFIRKAIAESEAIIAHNLSFDMEMLKIECERLGGLSIKWPRRLICLVEQTVHLKGFRLSMMNLHEHLFNEKFADAHRAKPDTQALIRCAVELYKRGDI